MKDFSFGLHIRWAISLWVCPLHSCSDWFLACIIFLPVAQLFVIAIEDILRRGVDNRTSSHSTSYVHFSTIFVASAFPLPFPPPSTYILTSSHFPSLWQVNMDAMCPKCTIWAQKHIFDCSICDHSDAMYQSGLRQITALVLQTRFRSWRLWPKSQRGSVVVAQKTMSVIPLIDTIVGSFLALFIGPRILSL